MAFSSHWYPEIDRLERSITGWVVVAKEIGNDTDLNWEALIVPQTLPPTNTSISASRPGALTLPIIVEIPRIAVAVRSVSPHPFFP